MPLSRRRLLQSTVASAVATIAFPALSKGAYSVFSGDPKTYSSRAIELMNRGMVIDMLAVLMPDLDQTSEAWSRVLTEDQADEFRRSGISVFNQSEGIGGPDAYEKALGYFAACNGFVARNSDLFRLVDGIEDLEKARRAGKIAVVMGVQNSEHFRTVEDVKTFYQYGQRTGQLTYNSQNRLGAGCTERVDGGVTDFGVAVIEAMNKLGILVDVSHCGDKTTLDAIEISNKPIAITHSNIWALNHNPRLKKDEAIKKLAAKGGVIGITGVRNFVRDREPTTIEHVVDHIDYVAEFVGVEHVGVGSDSDLHGADDMPPEILQSALKKLKSSLAFREKMDTDGFDHPRKFYDLTEVLIRRGYSDANIEAILGGNFYRLLSEVWTKA
jgi:membrane dipeptidase